MNDHKIDPETMQVGHQAQFVCEACNARLWKTWLPSDANTTFGEMYCYMHRPPEIMSITDSREGPGGRDGK